MKSYIKIVAIFLLAIMPSAMGALVPCPDVSGAVTADAVVNAVEGQYVKITITDPCDTGLYMYMWDFSPEITDESYVNPDPNAATSSCTVQFHAPYSTGTGCVDYYVNVDVTRKGYPSCTDHACIKVHVCEASCPVTDETFCDYDYNPATGSTQKTYTYSGPWDSSMHTQWWVNGNQIADFNDDLQVTIPYSLLNHPDSTTRTACTSIVFKLLDSQNTEVFSCSKQICLLWDPVAAITATTST